MADLHTFWDELDALPTNETPLTAAENDRLADAVLARTHAKPGEAPHKKSVHRAKPNKRRLPVWGKALAGAAACLAVLCGVNSVNPALAEGLPFVGDVFSFLNQQRFKTQLQSDQLAAQAQPTAVPAVPDTSSSTADTAGESSPYTLTLNQVYCDGLYLRIGLTLTAPEGDDSLAGYDWLAQDPGGENWLAICEQQADGTLLVDGQALTPLSGFTFQRVDDHTFAADMDYDLADYTGSTDAMDCTLAVAGLNGVQNAHDAAGHYLKAALNGSWTLHFTAEASDTANRIGTPAAPQVNGYTLASVIAAPGETRLTVQLPADAPDGAVLQLFTSDGTQLQCAGSRPSADGTAATYDFDAAPADAAALTARMVDKNTDPLAVLAQWQVTLPQE